MAQADSNIQKLPTESSRQKKADTQVLPKRTFAPARQLLRDSQPVKPLVPGSDSVPATLADSAALAKKTDSLRADSLNKAKVVPPSIDTSTYARYMQHPYLGEHKKAVNMIIDYRKREPKDELFYLLTGLVFFLAFIKVAFPRYFRNMFSAFFQTSLRLKQTKEQLLQDSLASLLSNLLFIMTVSVYAALVIRYEQWASVSFWQLILYGAIVLVAVYLGKYLFLLFSGWVFNSKEPAAGYIFIVFLVNKAIGILLIPFLLLVAFAAKPLAEVALTVSGGVIVVLFLYRYIVSFTAIRNNLKVNALHFFLYLCAVEVLPLLLLYKVIINYIDGRF